MNVSSKQNNIILKIKFDLKGKITNYFTDVCHATLAYSMIIVFKSWGVRKKKMH